MRPTHLRFTVRQLMVVTAILGFMMGAETVRRRWMYYHKRATEAGQGAAIIRSGAWGYRLVTDKSGRVHQIIDSPYALMWLNHYDALRRKYERAASRPWISMPPDPPPPTEWVPTSNAK
jgi:hypothetical protein